MNGRRLHFLRPHLAPLFFLVLATLAVYGGSFGHEFLTNWDDHLYITGNPAIRGVSPEHVRTVFSTYYVGNYAPVQMISYMIDYTLWGLRPAGYLLTNILLHAANGILFYVLMIRLGARRVAASLAAALFLLHPLQVESVCWISQRKNLLAMFFFLAAFLLYRSWRVGKGGVRSYAGSVGSFAVALLAKSVVVIMPPALVAHDFCLLPPDRRRHRITDTIPYAVLAVVVAVVAYLSQAPEYHGGRAPYHGGTPWTTFLTMLTVLCRYLGLLFWPVNLSAAYDPPVRTAIDAAVAFGAVTALLLVLLGVYLCRRRRDLFFWYVLFFLGFLPVAQIVPLATLMNDRYCYFPLLGAGALFGLLADEAFRKIGGGGGAVVPLTAALLLVPLGVLSQQRTGAWRTSVTLWEDAVAKAPARKNSWKALGEAYERNGGVEPALAAYGRALQLDHGYCEVLNNMALLYLRSGERGRARGYLDRVVAGCPAYAEGLQNLGHLQYDEGNLPAAEASFRRALDLDPRSAPSLLALGNIELKKGGIDVARDYFLRAEGVTGTTVETAYNRACLEAASGRPEAALQQLSTALRLGFRDGALLRGDPYLAPLRGIPSFERLLALLPPGR